MMVEFIAQDVLGGFLLLEICFPSTFFRDGESLHPSPLPTGGRSHGNNPGSRNTSLTTPGKMMVVNA